MRLLGATRLSHDTDASTSNERQRDQITLTAQTRGDTLVAITEDTDVSGAVSPFDRDGLGPWLTDPGLIARWDALIVVKLDRLTRSVRHFGDLLDWCKANGKNVISLDGEVNTDTATGWLHVQIIMTFAEFERRRMSERRADAAHKIYSYAGYNGGRALPWGYRPVRVNGRIELEPDPELVQVINEIADNVIAGISVRAEAQRNRMGQQTLLSRLRSPTLKGVVIFKGQIMRGDNGQAIRRDYVIEPAKWGRLQARLDANARGRSVPQDAYPWLHVIKCDTCKQDLYAQRWTNRPYFYFNHKTLKRHVREGIEPCRSKNFNGYDVEAQIEPLVMTALGDSYIPEVIELPADDRTAELAQVEEAIADLEADRYDRGLFKGDAGTARYVAIMKKLEDRADALRAMPVTEARKEIVMSDDLFRDRWASLETDDERGALLRKMGVRLLAWKDATGSVRLRLQQGSKHWADVAREWTDADVEAFEAG